VTPADRPLGVLLVEDEEMNRILLRAVLARAPDARIRGATVFEAASLAATRAFLSDPSMPIDVALLDVQLTDGSGLDLVREIVALVPRPKVVVMTAGVLLPQREAAQRAGCDAFLSKPYMPHELLDTLATLSPGAAA
jgi:two-component system KDP operon response regulator KdpE